MTTEQEAFDRIEALVTEGGTASETPPLVCPGCGSSYRGAAVDRLRKRSVWRRTEGGVLAQEVACVCEHRDGMMVPHPELGPDAFIVREYSTPKPMRFLSATRTQYVADGGRFHRSGGLAFHGFGMMHAYEVAQDERDRLEAWAASLGARGPR